MERSRPDFYVEKYGLTATHSEVLESTRYIQHGRALDLGCGRGRNALYLQGLGFDVTGFDENPQMIEILQSIITNEQLDHIRAFTQDANDAQIEGTFDLIVCTVVMMFLQADRIPDIIRNMQASTNPGGYNVIVCAMDTRDYPLPTDFMSFGFKPGELSNYYAGWTLHKYNEDIGELHKKDANGNRMPLRFATMIAQKAGTDLP